MVFGLQTHPKSWLTGYTFWVNHYLEIVFSKISVDEAAIWTILGVQKAPGGKKPIRKTEKKVATFFFGD